jgi:DNA-binding transcriptional ArsR family regulator
MSELDLTLTALADPTRRAILARLAAGEARVTEIAQPFAISLNSVSKHIRVLEQAGLVRRRVTGRDHHLSFDPAPLAAAETWMGETKALWAWRLARLEQILDEAKP